MSIQSKISKLISSGEGQNKVRTIKYSQTLFRLHSGRCWTQCPGWRHENHGHRWLEQRQAERPRDNQLGQNCPENLVFQPELLQIRPKRRFDPPIWPESGLCYSHKGTGPTNRSSTPACDSFWRFIDPASAIQAAGQRSRLFLEWNDQQQLPWYQDFEKQSANGARCQCWPSVSWQFLWRDKFRMDILYQSENSGI